MQVVSVLSNRIVQKAVAELDFHAATEYPNLSVNYSSSMATTTLRNMAVSINFCPSKRYYFISINSREENIPLSKRKTLL